MSKKYLKLSIDGWWTQDPEHQKRFNNSLIDKEAIYHEIARYYMLSMSDKYRPSFFDSDLSLDEYLVQYGDKIERVDLKLGEEILQLF